MKMYYHFLLSLLRHKWYVFLSGRKARVPLWRLIFHDWQKFTPKEFPVYARYFFGGKQNKEEFMYAWRHHLKYGPHHWDYWCINSNYNFSTATNGLLPMPETYVREMVADWHGAGREYQKNWDISEWIGINGPRMEPFMHNETVFLVHKIMGELGYSVTYGNNWVFHRQPDSFKVKQN